MKKKVILISIDGMRPDGLMQCGNPYVDTLLKMGSYTLDAKTVFPSKTLPCHMSMFHSIPPERHGITVNEYTPPVRPVNGICEQVKDFEGISCMYYGWEPLRDITRPLSLKASTFINAYTFEGSDGLLTDAALDYIPKKEPDFVFLYMVETDEKGGHGFGWMSEGYLGYISAAIDNVKRVIEAYGDKYTVIITADHGGHDRMHGTDLPEDMTIPMIFIGEDFEAGKRLRGVSILDIAPTVTAVMGIPAAPEWEGRALTKDADI